MKVLVIGSGGREHALVWKLRQSSRVTKVYCAPGNGGIAREAECISADIKSLESLLAAATRIQPDLTIVGPESPLALGVVDEFTRRGWRVFGPTRAAAQLESSKSIAKEFGVKRGDWGGLDIGKVADIGEDNVVVHDPSIADTSYAFALSRLGDQNLNHVPLGILRQVERPTYDDGARAQVEQAREARTPDLQGLLRGKDTWTVA